MNPKLYLSDPSWRDLVSTTFDERPMQLWRQRPEHILDLLDLGCRREDLDYLVQGDRRFSFADFHRAVEVAAAELQALHVKPGDRVLIVLHNSCEIPLLQWAAWRLGALPIFGNRWWTETELVAVVNQVTPSLIATDLPLVETTMSKARIVRPETLAEWWSLPSPGTAVPDPRPHANESDVCLVAFTAGSTGGPKGVELMHRNLIWTMQTLHVLQGGRPPEPVDSHAQKAALITTPMFHNGAIVTGILSLVDGGRLVMLRAKFVPEQVLSIIESERITSWMAVPTMFQRLMRDPNFPRHDLSSLVAPSTGGTMVRPELIDDIGLCLPHARDSVSVAYGMTEMSFISMATAAQLRERPGTVGMPVLGIEIHILEPDENGEGEILSRSGALMRGYMASSYQPIDEDGWYHTGDLGRIDADGFLYVTGRTKDMVIRGGENISCPHVEQIVGAHPDVLEVAVTGCPDADLGEALVAFVYLRAGARVTEAELGAYAKERLAYFSVPTRWIIEPEPLPTLPTGKIDKQHLARTLTGDKQKDAEIA